VYVNDYTGLDISIMFKVRELIDPKTKDAMQELMIGTMPIKVQHLPRGSRRSAVSVDLTSPGHADQGNVPVQPSLVDAGRRTTVNLQAFYSHLHLPALSRCTLRFARCSSSQH